MDLFGWGRVLGRKDVQSLPKAPWTGCVPFRLIVLDFSLANTMNTSQVTAIRVYIFVCPLTLRSTDRDRVRLIFRISTKSSQQITIQTPGLTLRAHSQITMTSTHSDESVIDPPKRGYESDEQEQQVRKRPFKKSRTETVSSSDKKSLRA
jgi:hypothetical protein